MIPTNHKPVVKDYMPIIVPRLDTTPRWAEILGIGTKVMDKCFSNWQLGYGSLLGAVREKDQYIHHDIDLDVDLLLQKEETLRKFEGMMAKEGFLPMRRQFFEYKKQNLLMSVAYSHKETKIVFDVCIFREFGNDYLHFGKEGLVIRPKWSEKRKELEVQGVKCYIPVEYDRYLTGRYGNWRTPKVIKDDWYNDAAVGDLFVPWDFGTKIERLY